MPKPRRWTTALPAFSSQVGRLHFWSCSLQSRLPEPPAESVCTSALGPCSAISPVVITFPQLTSLSWHSCPLLWARFRVGVQWLSPAHADYMSTIWHLVIHFLFSLACWSLNREVLLISLPSDHTKPSTREPRPILWTTVSLLIPDILSNSQDLCPGRYAKAGQCFHCNCTKKSQKQWDRASAMLLYCLLPRKCWQWMASTVCFPFKVCLNAY